MINVAIVGYGNIGKFAVEAVQADAEMNLLGVIRRSIPEVKPAELTYVPIVTSWQELAAKPDVVLLCTPTRAVEEEAPKYLKDGIATVDCYDMHTTTWELHEKLNAIAKEHGTVAIMSAGWDPGSDSVVRALLEACAPKGLTYTNFGPGMSMGHSVVARSKEGVKNALSMTIPVGTGLHRRMVYVELEDGADYETVKNAILADDYFAHDETHVIAVPSVDALQDRGHGVNLTRKGVSGMTDNQLFEFNMKINNPGLTSQVMTSCARAALKQAPGCYTMIELPLADLLPGTLEAKVRRLV